ncbi:GNAT family N-acetyltransferase [Paucisalibacillus globulus]|uniref:GNAT family N-acetyltransferase n=1 Tax=Paucisalibacillus globulus TaxID=351095 RepID=UPI000416860D|nr:GNAT family N-acetyltransferase [Paucisalibacillus globulus]
MGENMELKNAIDYFTRCEFYCSRQPTSQLYEYDSIKQLAFGTTVFGRTDEFFVYNSNPAYVMETINKQGIEENYWLTVLSDEKPHTYLAEGYTIRMTDYLMNLNLESWSFETENKNIRRVNTKKDAQRINDVYGKTAINLEKLDDPNLHFYVGEENGQPAIHGSYIIFDKTVCLDNIVTLKAHRRKGFAKALCRKMLLDAKKEGATESVLASSQMGHPLYLKLGYKDVSKMWVLERQS